jgi:imidazolonepropionase-like amidohydrolase
MNLRNTGMIISILVPFLAPKPSGAQTTPPDGLRNNTPSLHAFTNVRIIPSPGKVIENGTLVIDDGIVVSVGTGDPPSGAVVWDMKGMWIYPGFIDAYSSYGMPEPPKPPREEESPPAARPPKETGAQSWNPQVRPHQNAAEMFRPDQKSAEKLRSQGITTALVVPETGIFKGKSALVQTGDVPANEAILRDHVAHHITFDRGNTFEGYPQSLMGAIALIRQTLLDADWYGKAAEAYEKDPSITRPERDEALESLQGLIRKELPLVMETSDERELFRAHRIAEEFGLDLLVRGSGREYRRLDDVKGTAHTIILPLNFPEPPAVQTFEEALDVSLADLRYWDEAPENPSRLKKAGVRFSLTTSTLKDPSAFLSRLRKAVARGLSREDALASLTATPAADFGLADRLGSLDEGKIANFVIADGDVFEEKTRIRETWVDGRKYVVNPIPSTDPRGVWVLSLSTDPEKYELNLRGELDALTGTIKQKKEVKLKTASHSGLSVTVSFSGDSLEHPGIVRMTANVAPGELRGVGEWPDGKSFFWSATLLKGFQPEPDTTKPDIPQVASFTPVFPPGEFGRASIPDQPSVLLVRNATIWTSGPEGRLESSDLLVEKGRIRKVGKGLSVAANALIIDGTGKHVTPGMIDAHSHMATDGGVNEAGQAVSAEVRIGDIIDNDDISIYRALAGGLTTAHVLHGSANPIGGQSQLIKLRWGMSAEKMKFEGAPPTIKFALGENVKQSNWGERFTTRYPQTRMGVEQIMRDEFQAGLDYERAWKDYREDASGIPPRRDLELETILEILHGERFVHCHSYRQDEILATMRVAEDFGFRIGVFQHILEGY